MSFIKGLHSINDYRQLLSLTTPTKLVVLNFSAASNGPCQLINPVFERLSTKYRHVLFAKVDVDEVQEVAAACNVRSMPTFQFFKGGNKIAELKGANPSELEALIKQHQGPVSEDGSVAGVYGVVGHSDLTEFVTLSQLECLNQKEAHNVRNIFTKGSAYLESDVDEQLIIIVPFNQTVKLHSLKIIAPPSHAPKIIKLYMNRLSLGFDEAESVEETQLIELEEKDLAENAVVPLRFVKWQNVTSVVIFVENNQGDEETTKIEQLIFIGSPIETTKMSDLKKVGHEHDEAGPSK